MQFAAKSLVERVRILQERLDATPSAKIPELQLLTVSDWADAARGNLETENDFRKAFSTLRDWAVRNFLQSMSSALRRYQQTHNSDVPPSLADLKSYFDTPVSEEMLQRYQITSNSVLPSFAAVDRSGGGWSVTLKEVIDADNDALFELGRDGGVGTASYRDVAALKALEPAMRAFEANAPTNADGRIAFSPQQLLPYLITPEEKAAYEKLTRSRSPDLK
jgi:type II secretory pathway pseudopilin PulG